MTAYSFNIDLAQAGQIADASVRRVDSYPNHNGNLDFGVAVHINAQNQTYKSGRVDPVIGITVFSHNHSVGYYPPKSAVSVLTKGRIYVTTINVAVVNNTLAYIDVAGNFTDVAVGNAMVDNKLVGMFLTSSTVGGLSVLEFDFDTINIQ